MSATANWSYTAKATVWRNLGKDEYGDPLGYSAPLVIDCDYQGGMSEKIAGVSASLGNLGSEVVVKNTLWTEYADAQTGDFIFIGESVESDPLVAGADKILQVIRYADTFNRTADDYALLPRRAAGTCWPGTEQAGAALARRERKRTHGFIAGHSAGIH